MRASPAVRVGQSALSGRRVQAVVIGLLPEGDGRDGRAVSAGLRAG